MKQKKTMKRKVDNHLIFRRNLLWLSLFKACVSNLLVHVFWLTNLEIKDSSPTVWTNLHFFTRKRDKWSQLPPYSPSTSLTWLFCQCSDVNDTSSDLSQHKLYLCLVRVIIPKFRRPRLPETPDKEDNDKQKWQEVSWPPPLWISSTYFSVWSSCLPTVSCTMRFSTNLRSHTLSSWLSPHTYTSTFTIPHDRWLEPTVRSHTLLVTTSVIRLHRLWVEIRKSHQDFGYYWYVTTV